MSSADRADNAPVRAGLPRGIGTIVALLVAVPPIVDLVLSDRRRVFGYLAADAFYYLTVARNIAATGRSTFDGEFATNGYHPAWQALTAGLYVLRDAIGFGEPALLALVVLIGVACVAAAAWVVTRLIPDHPLSRALAPLMVVGPVALTMAPAWLHLGPEGVLAHSWQGRGRPLAGTLWSYANGMESGLVLAAFAGASWVWVKRSPSTSTRDAALLGLALAAMTLARLDHGLVAAGVLVPLGLGSLRSRRIAPALAAGAGLGGPVAVYLAVNKVVFGHALPVSGRLKSTFPELTSSFFDAVAALTGDSPPTFWLPFVVRVTLLSVPALLALVWLGCASVRRCSADAERFDGWLSGVAIGVLALIAYDVCFVPLQHQGHWYLPVATVFSALALTRLPALWVRSRAISGQMGRLLTVVAAAFTLLVFGLHRTPHNGHFAEFYYEVAPRVRAHYAEPPRIVSYDDGIVAFATGFPTLSGLGFTLDDEGVAALEEGRLLELAYARGYRHVTSLVYFVPWFLGPDVQSHLDSLVRSWPLGRGGEAPPFDFAIDYRTDDGEFVILRMEPHSAAR